MHVSNLISPRSGNKVANQFTIEENNTEYFQSYNTLIAKKTGYNFTISSNYNYSNTTSKYFASWLRSWGWTNTEIIQLKKWIDKQTEFSGGATFGQCMVELVKELK